MNDIFELLSIIAALRGRATAGYIVEAYCQKHHMIIQSQYKSTVTATLKAHSNRVSYDVASKDWYVLEQINEKPKSGGFDVQFAGLSYW